MKTAIALILLALLTACGGDADPDDGQASTQPVNCPASSPSCF